MKLVAPLVLLAISALACGYFVLTGDNLDESFNVYSSSGKLGVLFAALTGTALVWLLWAAVFGKRRPRDLAEADARGMDAKPRDVAPEPQSSEPPASEAATPNDVTTRQAEIDALKQAGQQARDAAVLARAAEQYASLAEDVAETEKRQLVPVLLSKRGHTLFVISQLGGYNASGLLDDAIGLLSAAATHEALQIHESFLIKTKTWLGNALLEKALREESPDVAGEAASNYADALDRLAEAKENQDIIRNIYNNRGRALLFIGQRTSDAGALDEAAISFEQATAMSRDLQQMPQVASNRELQAIATFGLARISEQVADMKQRATDYIREAEKIYADQGKPDLQARANALLEKIDALS